MADSMSTTNGVKLRSQDWFGRNDKLGFIHRSWMKSEGYPHHVFQGKPVIGICNSWSELTQLQHAPAAGGRGG